MVTFGFSAFLKLLSLNARPQRREIFQRSSPSEGGYDFHRSLRLRAHRLIVDGVDIEELINEAFDIKNPAERRSLVAGLQQLNKWRRENPGVSVELPSSIYTSQNLLFKVSFVPDFGWLIDGKELAIHVWNTGTVELSPRMTYAALTLASSAYEGTPPEDLAVLSLPDFKLYRLSDVADQKRFAGVVSAGIEAVFENVREEIGIDSVPVGPSIRLA